MMSIAPRPKRIGANVSFQPQMMQVDLADLAHAAGEKGIAYGCCQHDGDENCILGWL